MAGTREVTRAWREAFDAHDEERMRSLCTDDVVFEAPGDVRLQGRDAVVGYAMAWLRAFPDARTRVETEIADGDWGMSRFLFEGTHAGTLAGPAGEIPPTHRRLVGRTVEVVRVADGRISEAYLYFDQVQVMTQLGLMPEPVATA